MQTYSKEQLTNKSIDELHDIANEFGIQASGLDEIGLIYAILDAVADNAGSGKTTTRKRTRIKTVDRVYTANQEKAKKVDKTVQRSVDDSLFGSLSDEEQAMMVQTQEQEKNAAQSNTEDTAPAEEVPVEEPVKKRTRKSTAKNKKDADATDKPEQLEAAEAPVEAIADSTKETNAANGGDDFVVLEMATTSKSPKGRKSKTKTQEATESKTLFDTVATESSEEKNEIQEVPAATTEPYETQAPIAATDDIPHEADDMSVSWIEEQMAAADRGEIPDFIILDDIPSEASVININPLPYFKHYKETPQTSIVKQNDTTIAAEQAERGQKQQKAYDFSDLLTLTGVLEVIDNYGFLRSSDYNYLASPDDVYVNQAQIKHYALKTGDVIEGTVRPPKEGEKFFVLVNIKKINGCDPSVIRDRVSFEYLTPLFPDEKFKLCRGDVSDSHSSRIVDLFTPIGKGQRALIVAQPKTGKTLLMKDIANSIARNHPEAYLIMLLIDERPEEVTDMARTVNAEVVASTFDAPAENHVKIAGIVLEKAKRMVECGHDVVIFLDSITRLARAYNTVSPASGKVLSGGVDANALQKPKRFFGAARNIEGGGSLTIIATALIDTGSKMDEVIFEEFKGTGNMELQLDRSLSNKRIYPSVNLVASSTRRDDLLHDQTTLNRMWILRKHIADMTPMEAMDLLKNYMERTRSNEELLLSMNG